MEKEQDRAQALEGREDGHSSDSGIYIHSEDQADQTQEETSNSNDKVSSKNQGEPKKQTKSQKYQPKVVSNNQGSSSKLQSKEQTLSQTQKQSPERKKTKKTSSKRDFADEPIKQKKSKNQRQQKPDPTNTKTTSKQQPPKQASQKDLTLTYQQEWMVNNIDSDNENQKYLKDQNEPDENQQQSAFVEEQEIQNLTTVDQSSELNNAYIDKDVAIKLEHWVENKHLLVLYLLFRKQIYDQFPKKKSRRIDIHPSNKNKIRIFGTSNQEVKQISGKISELVNKIAIAKLNISHEEATKFKSSKLLNERLLKDKMVIFRYGNNEEKSYYLGGKGTQSHLVAVFKDIRNLRFRYFRVFDYKNTRSYSIILGHLIRQRELLKAFLKWSIKHIEIVQFIPSFNHGPKKDKERSLCFLMTTVGNAQNFSPKEIQLTMVPFIKNTFYSIALIFKKGEPYLPKLTVDGVFFRYVFERKFAWAYVYIMCTKKEFYAKRNEIISEIEKLAEKNVIFGVRYFDNIAPERADYIKPDIYKEIPYPENEPYSSSIIARRICQKEQQNKKEDNKEEGTEMKQKEERVWHKFDWKEHLMNINPREVPLGEQLKK